MPESDVSIDFDKMGGLLPVIVQDKDTKDVLMLAFMNPDAWNRTLATQRMWYFSRKRKKLWMKGEQSGHVQIVHGLRLDCDNDTLLAEVEQIGGACDLGYRSCFDKRFSGGKFTMETHPIFDPAEVYTYDETLKIAAPSGSLSAVTRDLLQKAFSCEPLDDTTKSVTLQLTQQEGDVEVDFINPRAISKEVSVGTFDAGITGLDWAIESNNQVVPFADLSFNKCGIGPAVWVVAVPESDKVANLSDLQNRQIVSELVSITERFFRDNGIKVSVRRRTGDHHQLFAGDPVVELIETGATVRKYNYRPICSVLETTAVFILNPQSYAYSWKRRRLEELRDQLVSTAKKLNRNTKTIFQSPTANWQAIRPMATWDSFRRSWFASETITEEAGI